LAEHVAGSDEGHYKQIRRCCAPIVGLRGGVPPQWSWPGKEDTGDVGSEGSRGGYGVVCVCGFFFLVWDPHASMPSTAETHTDGDAVLGKPGGSPARRHSRNSCHMFVYVVVCACSRHALDFIILLFRSFVSRKGYCVVLMLPTQKRFACEFPTENRNCLSLPTRVGFFEKVPTKKPPTEERKRLGATHT